MRTILLVLFVLISGAGYGQDEVPSFAGYIGTPTDETENLYKRFNDFMLENEGKNVTVNLTLDDTQMDMLRTPTDDFFFFAVYDNYDERMSGIEYHIMKFKDPANYEVSTVGNNLSGEFKIGEIKGPQNGLLIVEMTPVKKKSR